MADDIFWYGDKVHWIPYDGADRSLWENGIVKSSSADGKIIFVVYDCCGEWDTFWNYTGCGTSSKELGRDWIS